MFKWLYVTRAQSIQSYIFSTNKLKEIVGASELVETLVSSFLDRFIRELSIDQSKYRIISQSAGIARILFTDEVDVMKLYRYWPMVARQWAPGLEVVQAVVEYTGSYESATNEIEKKLGVERNFPHVDLPVAGPLVIRSRRNGEPAVGRKKDSDGWIYVSKSQDRKLEAEGPSHFSMISKLNRASKKYDRWERNFDDLVSDDNRYLALIHADGNNLGQLSIQLGNQLEILAKENQSIDSAEIYQNFSKAISDSTQQALNFAIEPIITEYDNLSERYPFRLLVCAGDDMTIVMDAAHSVDFIERYLKEFTKQTRSHLAQALQAAPSAAKLFASGLTATAGIAYLKPHFPFNRAYEVCESLCGFAKNKTERKHSAIAFWRITTSSTNPIQETIEHELTAKNGLTLTMMPYVVDSLETSFPDFGKLVELAKMIGQELPKGALNETISACYDSQNEARKRWNRLIEVLSSSKKLPKDLTGKLKGKLSDLGLADDQLPFNQMNATPLADALTLSAWMGKERIKDQ